MQEAARQKFEKVMNDPNVPQIYVNNLQSGYNNTDFILLLESNGRPSAVLNMSYTLAKTLVETIGNNITDLEAKLGHSIRSMEEMDRLRQTITNAGTDQE
jgi:hypothetical protein